MRQNPSFIAGMLATGLPLYFQENIKADQEEAFVSIGGGKVQIMRGDGVGENFLDLKNLFIFSKGVSKGRSDHPRIQAYTYKICLIDELIILLNLMM